MQAFGVELLIYADGIRSSRNEVKKAGLALVAAGERTLEDIYPDWYPVKVVEAGTPEAEAALSSGDAIEDFTEVKWVTPGDENEDFDELLRLQEELAHRAISVPEEGGDWQ